jgi:hypothetical protein
VNLVDSTGLGTINNAIAGFIAGLGGVLDVSVELIDGLPNVEDTNVIVSPIENWNPLSELLFGEFLVDTHSTEFEGV